MGVRPRRRPLGWRVGVPIACGLAGLLFATSAISADGYDLRSNITDLPTLVRDRAASVADLRDQQLQLRQQINALTGSVSNEAMTSARRKVAALTPVAGLTAVKGPGLRVVLDDAPQDQATPEGFDPNLLLVHQQDIQGFVNALWAGGATAISIQGQRLVSTTGVKCVGNTVVLQGVPYSPPYVIEAVGDIATLRSALEQSQAVRRYREYVDRFSLGLTVTAVPGLAVAAYDGVPQLQHAQPMASAR